MSKYIVVSDYADSGFKSFDSYEEAYEWFKEMQQDPNTNGVDWYLTKVTDFYQSK